MNNQGERERKKERKLYSFDIFDTLVTRRLAKPNGIFTLVQDALKTKSNISDFVVNNFYKIRIETEKYARFIAKQSENRTEVTFDEIYSIIQYSYNLSNEECEFIKELEFSTEKKNLVPIEKNIELLKSYISEGKRVVLISDMYYEEKQLRELLLSINPIFEKIKIYSSADHKVSKSEGKLYPVVKNLEQVDYHAWVHIGDNKKADIQMAKRYGIKTIHFQNAKLMKYEEYLLNENDANKYYQAIIGSAKLARTTKITNNLDKYIFGASFAGPILYNYVDWLLKQAISKGFKTLYFVSRDGYIPKLITDIVIEKRNLAIKTKYIYGSRLVWRELTEENYDTLVDYCFAEYKNLLTPEFISYRLGGTPQKIAEILELSTTNSKIKRKSNKICAGKLKSIPAKKYLLDANKSKSALLQKYFKQEIDFTEQDIAFVDLHGSGRTQDIVSQFLNKIQPCNLYFFYLTNSSLTKQQKSSIKFTYLPAEKYRHFWVELLCRTTYGQTTGYSEENGIIKPITENENQIKKAMLNWGYNEYLEGIKAYVKQIIEIEDLNETSFNTLYLFCKYYDFVLKKMDKETADILGTIPFSVSGFSENATSIVAPQIPFYKFLLKFIFCCKHGTHTATLFISFARSCFLIRKFRNFWEECPTLQKFLFNVKIHKRSNIAYMRILGIKISLKTLLK